MVYLGVTAVGILSGWVVAGIITVIMALIIDALKFSMSWYNNPWIILGLYAIPTFNCCCGSIVLFNKLFEKVFKRLGRS